jgi:hypothetical protein
MKAELALAAASTTLICCVLPAALVALGFGSTLVTVLAFAPGLVTLSEYSFWVFGGAAAVVMFSGAGLWRQSRAACPIDPVLRTACIRGRQWSLRIWLLSVALLVMGGIVTLLPRLSG